MAAEPSATPAAAVQHETQLLLEENATTSDPGAPSLLELQMTASTRQFLQAAMNSTVDQWWTWIESWQQRQEEQPGGWKWLVQMALRRLGVGTGNDNGRRRLWSKMVLSWSLDFLSLCFTHATLAEYFQGLERRAPHQNRALSLGDWCKSAMLETLAWQLFPPLPPESPVARDNEEEEEDEEEDENDTHPMAKTRTTRRMARLARCVWLWWCHKHHWMGHTTTTTGVAALRVVYRFLYGMGWIPYDSFLRHACGVVVVRRRRRPTPQPVSQTRFLAPTVSTLLLWGYLTGGMGTVARELQGLRRRFLETTLLQEEDDEDDDTNDEPHASTTTREWTSSSSSPFPNAKSKKKNRLVPPPPPPPPLQQKQQHHGRSSKDTCPLCQETRRLPTAATSGMVYCFPCLLHHVRHVGEYCPVTGQPCGEPDVVRLFETTR